MKKGLFAFTALLVLFCFSGCKDRSFSKAQKIYDEDGFEAYVDFVKKKNTYYPIEMAPDGLSPLLFSMKEKNDEAVCLFLETGAQIFDEIDGHGRGFFDYFLQISDVATKNKIAGKISHVLWYASMGRTDYLNAIELILDNDVEREVIQALMDKGFLDPDYGYIKGKTPLMFAAQRNTDVDILSCLLAQSKAPNATNENKWTAAMYAARYNPNPAILEQLILKSSDHEPNDFGVTLTMLAACNPNPGVLLQVPNAMTQIDFQAQNGKTALMYACENKQPLSTVRVLVSLFGANLNIADADGKTSLMYAVSSYNSPEVVKYLIESGASIELFDNNGNGFDYYLQSNDTLRNSELRVLMTSHTETGLDTDAEHGDNLDDPEEVKRLQEIDLNSLY